jgi:hypothetical protein
MIDLLDQLVEQYLALESMEATESLLELCGARITEQALPLLKQRVLEEEAQIPLWETHGYVRLREKSEQLVGALKPLITTLERMKHEKEEDKG